MDSLEGLVQLLVALSIASERLVEIIKGFVPFLNEAPKNDPHHVKEGRRRSTLQILAVISGIVTAFLARYLVDDIVPAEWDHPAGFLALGLLAAGGSGFWNGILSYVLEVKNLKKRTDPATR